jgi:hypothetical protein
MNSNKTKRVAALATLAVTDLMIAHYDANHGPRWATPAQRRAIRRKRAAVAARLCLP